MRTLLRSLALLLGCCGCTALTLTAQQPPAGVPGYPQQGGVPGPGGYLQNQGGYFSGYQQAPGGGYQPYNPYLPPPPVRTTEILIYDNYFTPPSIQVSPGATVRWTNKGQKPHRVAELTGKWLSPELAPGDSWSVTLRKPLNHYYYCRHNRLTMNASIVVK